MARPHPDWIVPTGLPEQVGALMSTRAGGVSLGLYDSMNLGGYVGDDPVAVRANRQVLAEATQAQPVFLRQVHGTRVVELQPDVIGTEPEADACFTTQRGLACTIQVADCLPVLFAAPGGVAVGAAHAGWRGLAGGVLEATIEAVCRAAACEARALSAWMGPCIGPDDFEVGADVLAAFGVDAGSETGALAACFRRGALGADGRPRWLADLQGLARARLGRAGVVQVAAFAGHTFESRFFSFRRDGVTGRLVACIWIR